VRDPQGIAWEAFHSQGTIELYDGACGSGESACCADEASVGEAPTQRATQAAGCCAQERDEVAVATVAAPARGCCR
jgi:hypothetical protein